MKGSRMRQICRIIPERTLELISLFCMLVAFLSACAGGPNDQRESFGRWTWISGNDATGQAGVYGARVTASSANVPGARFSAMSWALEGQARFIASLQRRACHANSYSSEYRH
jgi:hypothetical protein